MSLSDFEHGIRLMWGAAGKCDQCDVPIRPRERYIEATFKVGVAIINLPIRKSLCLDCAGDLANALLRRLREAGWK